jgi:hypothetical protein
MMPQRFLQRAFFVERVVFIGTMKPFEREGIGNSRSLSQQLPYRHLLRIGMRGVIGAQRFVQGEFLPFDKLQNRSAVTTLVEELAMNVVWCETGVWACRSAKPAVCSNRTSLASVTTY